MKKFLCVAIMMFISANIYSENNSLDIFNLIKSYNQGTTLKKKNILEQVIGKKYVLTGSVIDADSDKDGYFVYISLVEKIKSDFDYYIGMDEDKKRIAEQEYLSNMFSIKVYLPKENIISLDIDQDIKLSVTVYKYSIQNGKIIFYCK